ncbi:hypothetical protein [Ferruginibacter sp.]
MKLIFNLGQTFYLLITFSILIVHNEYWDSPLILWILLNLQNTATNYIYPLLPFLSLSMFLFTMAKYGKQNFFILKYIINITAYLLLLGSVFLPPYLEGESNEGLFNGIIPFITLLLFFLSSICFLITNITGLIKISAGKQS